MPQTEFEEQPDRLGDAYQPPSIVRLGTLAELTLGGGFGISDGLGAAGDEGSIGP